MDTVANIFYHLHGSIVGSMEDGRHARLERLLSMLKRRGVILPAFEIHGGVAGLFDYGPIGGRLRRNVEQQWLQHWLSMGDIVEIDSPTLTPYSVLEASGHVGAFNDHAIECGGCGAVHRADHLVVDYHPNPDSLSAEELDSLINQHVVECPSCAENSKWLGAKPMNLMFSTKIGATKGGRQGFMRPETAQGMYTMYPAIYRHFREKLPFGAVQVGKGYRNEISPRQGMIRLREFYMAELEYFVDPKMESVYDYTKWDGIKFKLIPDGKEMRDMNISEAYKEGIIRDNTVAYFMCQTWEFLRKLGIDVDRMRFRQHESDEMAHYATDCWDLEIHGSYGWIECVGIAHRGCYDLQSHQNATGQRLGAWRSFAEPIEKEVLKIGLDTGKAGPVFREKVSQIVEKLSDLVEVPKLFPLQIELNDGEIIQLEESFVKVTKGTEVVHGEWFTPHVIEPAFGIDRIIWHLIDHAYEETEKDNKEYRVLRTAKSVSPIDVAIFPLFEKEGMDELAKSLKNKLTNRGISCYYDGSGSIGRRYARADEVGVPIAITVDHQSLTDSCVTIRDRDTQSQERIEINNLENYL